MATSRSKSVTNLSKNTCFSNFFLSKQAHKDLTSVKGTDFFIGWLVVCQVLRSRLQIERMDLEQQMHNSTTDLRAVEMEPVEITPNTKDNVDDIQVGDG